MAKLEDKGWIRRVSDGGKGGKVYIHPNAIEEARTNERRVVQLSKRFASKKKASKDESDNSKYIVVETTTNKADVSKTTVKDGPITDSFLISETNDVDFSEVETLITSVSCNS